MTTYIDKCLCTSLSEKAGETYTQKVVGGTTYYGKYSKAKFLFTSSRYYNRNVTITISQTTGDHMVFFDDGTVTKSTTIGSSSGVVLTFFVCSTSEETTSWRKENDVELTFEFDTGDIIAVKFDVVHFYFDSNGDVQGATIVDTYHTDTKSNDNGLLLFDTNGSWDNTVGVSDYINGKYDVLRLDSYNEYGRWYITSTVSNRYIFSYQTNFQRYRRIYYSCNETDAFRIDLITGITTGATISLCSKRCIKVWGDETYKVSTVHDVLLLDF